MQVAIAIALVSILVAAASPVGQAKAGGQHVCGCPTCGECGSGCFTISYQIDIYNDEAAAVVNGSTYTNGEITAEFPYEGQLCVSTKYTLSATDVASGYSFKEWYVTNGVVSSPDSKSTTFTTGSGFEPNQVIVLILAITNLNSVGGYIVSGKAIDEVSGTFTIPSNYNQIDTGAGNFLGTWVGIGGVNGFDFWQAGVGVEIGLHTFSLYAWYESYPEPQIVIPLNVEPGTITVTVGNDQAGGWAIWNGSTAGDTYSVSGISNSADRSTAEWVVEAPCGSTDCSSDLGPLPTVSPAIKFTNANYVDKGVSYAYSFSAPVAFIQLEDIYLHYAVGFCENQYYTPTDIANGAFTEKYSTSPTYCV